MERRADPRPLSFIPMRGQEFALADTIEVLASMPARFARRDGDRKPINCTTRDNRHYRV
jgi:acyl dehydratase